MSSILFRTAELRPGEGRTVYGVIVPYGEVTTVRDLDGEFREMFAPGAFRRSIAERGHKVKLLVSHDARTRYLAGPSSCVRSLTACSGRSSLRTPRTATRPWRM